ncbi:hypothetical protein K469DRAFT_697239 [Zopfia rhizophila CBS 207.26]|uniref:Uncharacterized protein n=1 Tax=Zopfia rhizophila CBS 207.26 TaxID=1314779 RepID=A0A6A6EKY4_9PEZI|nr:hypothetical protein K469DRAFT_697239 [Zopfia rhizophila CBS 207.26]
MKFCTNSHFIVLASCVALLPSFASASYNMTVAAYDGPDVPGECTGAYLGYTGGDCELSGRNAQFINGACAVVTSLDSDCCVAQLFSDTGCTNQKSKPLPDQWNSMVGGLDETVRALSNFGDKVTVLDSLVFGRPCYGGFPTSFYANAKAFYIEVS